MKKLAQKSGFTTCPVCMILGIGQEPYMACPTSDDRVYCHACNNVAHPVAHIAHKGEAATLWKAVESLRELPKPLFDLVVDLMVHKVGDDMMMLETYFLASIGSKGLGFSNPMTPNDMMRASVAVACGNADVVIDEAKRVHIALANGKYAFSTLRLSYQPEDLEAALTVGNDCSDEVRDLLERLPEAEATAVAKLAKRGFSLGHVNIDESMKHVRMHKGSAGAGIAAEFSWIV